MVKTIYNNIFKVRVNDDDEKGGCTFVGGSWKDVSTDDLFTGLAPACNQGHKGGNINKDPLVQGDPKPS